MSEIMESVGYDDRKVSSSDSYAHTCKLPDERKGSRSGRNLRHLPDLRHGKKSLWIVSHRLKLTNMLNCNEFFNT